MADEATGGEAAGSTNQQTTDGNAAPTDLLNGEQTSNDAGNGGTSTDGKPDGDGAGGTGDGTPADLLGDDSDGDGKDDTPPGAPEQYEALQVPDGVEIDEALQTRFFDLGKELNLPQQAMQKLFDFQQSLATEAQEAAAAANAEAARAEQEQVQQLLAQQKEFERDPKFKEITATAKAGLEGAFSPESVKILRELGVTRHPSVVRDIAKNIGKYFADDTFAGRGGTGKAEPKSWAERLHPGLPPT